MSELKGHSRLGHLRALLVGAVSARVGELSRSTTLATGLD